VAIVGWDAIGYGRERRDRAVRDLMATMRSSSSPPRQYLVLSVNDLRSIFDAAKAGISIIGTDLVRQWSRNGNALCLKLAYGGSDKDDSADETTGGLIELRCERYARDSSVLLSGCRCIVCHPHFKSPSNHHGVRARVTSPSFSRAYIHHLIKAKEMLAETLLFVHNLHQMLLLFRRLSEEASLDEGDEIDTGKMNKTLVNFCNRIEKQL
jgi:queuine tRNA-ribosyltransferase